ncbi:GntR family transcriptional regulator [Streptomyces sp. NBC_01751]|uniref:GntR family transcriptional regulator n=1 Tax=Streptomyces sp. NBC_01751 TaxID=2975929 RepID=UPI002DDAB5DB|nr:GntR family transcriptional regulator [Streptomyces sp. NBC_01751]WSD24582.1 GntR family transcriptional regulator [Streptomyces sp. NBC_01751]
MIEWDDTRPRWEQVSERIKAEIEAGTLPSGARVPSVVALVRDYGIAQATAQKALVALREEGLIKTTRGMGSFVI